jgi:hypothetical protein
MTTTKVRRYNYMLIFPTHRPFPFFFGRSTLAINGKLVFRECLLLNGLSHNKVHPLIVLNFVFKSSVGRKGGVLSNRAFNFAGTLRSSLPGSNKSNVSANCASES